VADGDRQQIADGLEPSPIVRPNVYVTSLRIATRTSPPVMAMPLVR
jgi:hypothetical protein